MGAGLLARVKVKVLRPANARDCQHPQQRKRQNENSNETFPRDDNPNASEFNVTATHIDAAIACLHVLLFGQLFCIRSSHINSDEYNDICPPTCISTCTGGLRSSSTNGR